MYNIIDFQPGSIGLFFNFRRKWEFFGSEVKTTIVKEKIQENNSMARVKVG